MSDAANTEAQQTLINESPIIPDYLCALALSSSSPNGYPDQSEVFSCKDVHVSEVQNGLLLLT